MSKKVSKLSTQRYQHWIQAYFLASSASEQWRDLVQTPFVGEERVTDEDISRAISQMQAIISLLQKAKESGDE